MNLQKREPYRNKEILRNAKGKRCTIEHPEFCNHDPFTTVAAHFNDGWAGKGLGQKADDCAVVYACSGCHDWIDGRVKSDYSENDKDWYLRRGLYRTILQCLNDGVLK